MYDLFRGNLPGVEFSDSRIYVHLIEDGPEESLFGLPEKLACKKAAIKPIGIE